MSRHRIVITAVVAFAVAAGTARASSFNLTATPSTHRAKAQAVRLAVLLKYEMQCGYPGSTPVSVVVPGTLPKRVPRTAILVDGKPATKVTVIGHRLTIAMPARPQVLCDVIGPGALKLVIREAARLANPARPGRYTISVRRGTFVVSTPFAVR